MVKRQADFVVHISGAFQRAVTLVEHFGDDFLGRGFSHAAGNADHSQVQFSPPEIGQSAGVQ